MLNKGKSESVDFRQMLSEFDINGAPLTLDDLDDYSIVENLVNDIVEATSLGKNLATMKSPKKLNAKTLQKNVDFLRKLAQELELRGRYKAIDNLTMALYQCGDLYADQYNDVIAQYLESVIEYNSNLKGFSNFRYKIISSEMVLALMLCASSKAGIVLCTSLISTVIIMPALLILQLCCALYIAHLLVDILAVYAVNRYYSITLSEGQLIGKLDFNNFFGIRYAKLYDTQTSAGRIISEKEQKDDDQGPLELKILNILRSYTYLDRNQFVLNSERIKAQLGAELNKLSNGSDVAAKERGEVFNVHNFKALLAEISSDQDKEYVRALRDAALNGALKMKLEELYVLNELHSTLTIANYKSVLDRTYAMPTLVIPGVIGYVKHDKSRHALESCYTCMFNFYHAAVGRSYEKYYAYMSKGVVCGSFDAYLSALDSQQVGKDNMIKQLEEANEDVTTPIKSRKSRSERDREEGSDIVPSILSYLRIDDPHLLKRMGVMSKTVLTCALGYLLYSFISSPIVFPLAAAVLVYKCYDLVTTHVNISNNGDVTVCL